MTDDIRPIDPAQMPRRGEWLLLGLALAAATGFGWLSWRAYASGDTPAPAGHQATTVAAFSAASTPTTSAARRPHVLLVSLDTLRADRLSCYGYGRPTTPHLDRLAAASWRFAHCAAVSNWTLPAHASMFTGLYPDRHGARLLSKEEAPRVSADNPAGVLPEECHTLAERLAEVGYQTVGVAANWAYLSPVYQLDQGFAHYDARPPATAGQSYRTATEITDAALAVLARRDNRPLFLFLNYMDPHHPNNPPAEYLDRFEENSRADRAPKSSDYFQRLMGDVVFGRQALPPATRRWWTNRYDAEVAYLDTELGRLFDALREQGLYDDTLIVVTADHGEGLGEHDTLGHGFRLYENELAVPLIVKPPGGTVARVVEKRVSQIDVLPTVLDLLGLPADAALDGLSLRTPRERELVAVKHRDLRMIDAPPPLGQLQWALYRGRWKYLESAAGPVELYDLAVDPEEANNLAGAEAELVSELARRLAEYRKHTHLIAPLQAVDASDEIELLRALRELGYAQ